MHLISCFFFCILSLIAASQKKISLESPPAVASLFAEGIISTQYSERDFALSPDGTEIFYTLQSPARAVFQTILYMKKDMKGVWSKPEVAPFAGKYSDLEPAFTSDGSKLFFCSNRPLNGTAAKDFDIWYTEKKNGKWGEPINIGLPVNTDADEFYPSLTATGNLYFTAAYKSAIGLEDIYVAKWENEKYLNPVPLDSGVNSKTYEFNAFVSPDESFILFTSYGRSDDAGGGDLYMSKKDENGNWGKAKNMRLLNSDKLDYCPFVSFDKKMLFFTSEKHSLQKSFETPTKLDRLIQSFTTPLNGGGNIYWIEFDEITTN